MWISRLALASPFCLELREPENPHCSIALRLEQSRNAIEQCGLSGSRSSKQNGDARANLEIHIQFERGVMTKWAFEAHPRGERHAGVLHGRRITHRASPATESTLAG